LLGTKGYVVVVVLERYFGYVVFILIPIVFSLLSFVEPLGFALAFV
jgi:hypothetical protein